jgi:hypothetical protein
MQCIKWEERINDLLLFIIIEGRDRGERHRDRADNKKPKPRSFNNDV